MAKKEKIDFKEAFSLHIRSYKDINQYCPGLLLSYVLYSVVSAVTPYVTVYLSAQIINELAGARRTENLWFWVWVTIGAEAILALLKAILLRWKNTKLRERKNKIYVDKILAMDYADVDKQENRDLLAQIQQNEMWNGWGYYEAMWILQHTVNAVSGILGAITLTVSLFTIPVPEKAGMLTVLNHPGFLVGLVIMMAIVTVIGPVCSSITNEATAKLAEKARLGNRIFGAFGFMCWEQNKAMDLRMYKQHEIAEHYMKQSKSFGTGSAYAKLFSGKIGVMNALAQGTSASFSGMIYVFVCLKAWAGAFGIGSVTQYISAVTALSKNVALLIEQFGNMRSNTAFLRTTYQFLDIPNNMYQGSLTTEKRRDRQYEVEFKDVSFKYPGSEIWALRHVSLKFKVGNRLAVVGENGSGKTTFIKLLCRLYDPQEGQILLNGIDIRKYNYRDYMNIFSVVFQDFQLVSQPLGANVAGCMEYDREKVEKCLIDAGFGERLKNLPEGLDTYLYKDFAEDGVDVSGGEAQKIAIARALYKDAPFIILDEPTASLDPIAEAEIYSKFNDIAGDKTAIYISHRLSSCKFCDEIAVIHEGAVIQQGSHEELVADESGKYYELWHAQAQYYTKQEA